MILNYILKSITNHLIRYLDTKKKCEQALIKT